MSVTFTASANATPASGIIVATCTVGGEEYQLMILAGQDGNTFGVGIASPLFSRISDGVDSVVVNAASRLTTEASIIGGSVALLAGANTIGVASVIQASPNTLANAWPTRVTDTTDGLSITTASEALVFVNNTASTIVSSGSVVVTNALSASISNTASVIVNSGSVVVTNGLSASISGGSVALLAGTNAIGVVTQGASGASPWGVRLVDKTGASEFGTGVGSPIFAQLSDGVDGVAVNSSSQLLVSVSNVASVIVSSGSVVVTNGLSASVSGGSVALLAGANVIGTASVIQSSPNTLANAWPARVTDTTDGLAITAASEALVFVNNAASVVVSSGSVVVTNAQSTSISGGSVALLTGANVIGTASVIQSTPNSNANGWPVKITDGTNIYGVPSSPLSVADDANRIWWVGSLLTSSQIDLSSSVSGCTRIVASGGAGSAIVIIQATFTTSGCQRIGWIASGAGAASAFVSTPMPFGTNGGMSESRAPYGFLWSFPSGSNAIVTTTSACYVAGTITYLMVASA